MSIPPRFALSALALAALVAPGCEDAEAVRRAELQARIEESTRAIAAASATVAAPHDEAAAQQTRQALSRVAGDLSGVSDGAPGQQAAAALLASAALRQIGGLDLAHAEEIEARHDLLRAIANSHLDAALRLAAEAEGRSASDTARQRELLAQARSHVESARSEFSRQMADLDGPIADRRGANASDQQEVETLVAEANDLFQEARQRGHRAGLATFTEAVRTEREADQFRMQIANREGELAYEYEPEHALAEWQVDTMSSILETITTSIDALGQRDQVVADATSAIRATVAEFRTAIEATIDAIDADAEGLLGETYESARASLDRAAQQASRAAQRGSRDAAGSARVAAARSHELLGQLNAMQARGAEGQAMLLDRVVAAGGALGAGTNYRAARDAARAAATEAKAAAVAAYGQAAQELANAGGSAEVGAFRASIDAALRALGADAAPTGAGSGARGGGDMDAGSMDAGAMDAGDVGDDDADGSP